MSAMSGLRDFFRRERRIAEQRRELAALRAELAAQREELAEQRRRNERMRAGMRRCVTCDYRIEAAGRRAGSAGDAGSSCR